MNIAKVKSDKKVLVALVRRNRKASGQISGSPLGAVEGKRVTVERGVKGIGGNRVKGRDE